MFYTVYKITNKVNGKIYIGVHKTSDLNDSYMGSGKVIRAAVKKYGIENFNREYLKVFDNPEDMFNMESDLVNEDFIARDDTYNLKIGGVGGWGHLNTPEELLARASNQGNSNWREAMQIGLDLHHYKLQTDIEYRHAFGKSISIALKESIATNGHCWLSKTHSIETKAKMSEKAKLRVGEKNSSFGSMWIMNIETHGSKKIKKTDEIPVGWVKGRKIKS